MTAGLALAVSCLIRASQTRSKLFQFYFKQKIANIYLLQPLRCERLLVFYDEKQIVFGVLDRTKQDI